MKEFKIIYTYQIPGQRVNSDIKIIEADSPFAAVAQYLANLLSRAAVIYRT